MKSLLLKAYPRFRYFVGDGDGGGGGDGGGTDGGTGTDGGGGGTDGGTGTDGTGTDPKKKTEEDENKPKFSQKQLNKMLADDRRKHEDKVNKTVQQLEELKKAKGLTDQEKTKLALQIEELQNSLLTKEEQTKKELEKKDKEYKKNLEHTTHERDYWQTSYAEETTRNQILMASATHEAVSAEQLIDFLMPKTRLVEVMGEDGKSQTPRKFLPKVKFRTKNDKGEEIELDFTIEEAVKRMTDEPERFGNLFKSGLRGGLGGNGSVSGGNVATGDKPPSDPAQYRLWRKSHKLTSRK